MQKIYYEITKTMNNLPISIYPHKKIPCQIYTAHWHRSLELSIVFEGEVIFFNDGMKRIRYKNEVNISNCGEIHYSIPQYKEFDEKIVGYTMQINYGFLKKMIPDIKNIYFNIDEPFLNKKITKYMMDIYSFYISNQSTRYMNILMVTLEMLIFLYENCKNERKMIETEKTKDILEYVDNHYNEELLVYEVAKHFGYSREYFSRFFKKEIGMPFKDYLTQYRLNKSLIELELNNKTITDIAFNTGFSNETQYINSFKKRFKLTPGQYRKSHINDEKVTK